MDLGIDFSSVMNWMPMASGSSNQGTNLGSSANTGAAVSSAVSIPQMQVEIPPTTLNSAAPLSPPAGLMSPTNAGTNSLLNSGPIAPPPDLNNQPIPAPPELMTPTASLPISNSNFVTTALGTQGLGTQTSLAQMPFSSGLPGTNAALGVSTATSSSGVGQPRKQTVALTAADFERMTPQQLKAILSKLPVEKQRQLMNQLRVSRAAAAVAAASGQQSQANAVAQAALRQQQANRQQQVNAALLANLNAGTVTSGISQPVVSTLATATHSAPPNATTGRVPWQSDADILQRRKMISKIVVLLQQRKPDAPPEWVRKLPEMARRLEDSLYRSASSLEEYSNFATLKQRLQQLAVRMGAPNNTQQQPRAAGQNNVPLGNAATPAQASLLASNAQQRQALLANMQRSQGLISNPTLSTSQPAAAQGKRFVNVGDINPTLQPSSMATSMITGTGISAASSTISTPTTALSSAQDVKPIVMQSSPDASPGAGAAARTGGTGTQQQQQQHVLRQQQQRLLLLRHASRCPLAEKTCSVPHCAAMKQLWKHITTCQDQRCSVSHCVSSRYVLSHYQRCKDARCPVCGPVRQVIERQRQQLQGQQANGTNSGSATATTNASSSSAPSHGTGLTAGVKRQSPSQSDSTSNGSAAPTGAKSPVVVKTPGVGGGAGVSQGQIKQAPGSGPPIKRQKTASPGVLASAGGKSSMAPKQGASSLSSSTSKTSNLAVVPGDAPLSTAQTLAQQAAALRLQQQAAAQQALAPKKPSRPTYMKEGTSFCASYTDEEIDVHLESLQKGFNNTIAPGLKQKLQQIIKNLLDHKHGWVFSNPVDPVALNIPDYFDIIKNPMDLGTMKKRLEPQAQFYKTHEQVADDVRLTFENAKTYNEEGSDVYNLACQMLEKFEEDYALLKAEIDAEEKKRREGANACRLCGGEKFTFEPMVFYCNGTCNTRIRRNSYYYTNSENKYHWCQNCYQDLREEQITVSDGSVVKKNELVKKKNDEVHEESWVQCDCCNRWVHQICALFNGRNVESNNNTQYFCPVCLKDKRKADAEKYKPQPRPLGARDLPKCKFSDYLENAVQQALDKARREEAARTGKALADVETAEGITIRQVSAMEKQIVVREKMYERYKDSPSYPQEFHYKSKCIVMFQEIDGIDVLLFGMYVHEFDHTAPEPNNRRVYISYLDSVQYFKPRLLRTVVYHEMLVAYIAYVRNRGFHTAHIWACPPLKGDDYILYCHPEEQKTPKSDRLRLWYITLLLIAQKRGYVAEITNLYTECFASGQPASVLPYFEGDYWTGVAEEFIKSLEDEQKEEAEKGKKRGNKKANKKKGNKKGTRSSGPPEAENNKNRDPLMVKLGSVIEPMKDDFIVVKLYHYCQECRKPILSGRRWKCATCPPTDLIMNPTNVEYNLCDSCYESFLQKPATEQHPAGESLVHALIPEKVVVPAQVTDDDEVMECEFFDTRQEFLSLCQGNHYQFDQLRRAKHTSMMVLYHLHNPTAPAYIHTCDNCKNDITTGMRYHCDTCSDFDLCESCYQKIKHKHELKPFPVSGAGKDEAAEKARRDRARSIQLHMQLLAHASACVDPACPSANCSKMKQLLRHGATCSLGAKGGCHICRRIWALLQIHARQCRLEQCAVPRCKDLKEHLRRLARQQAASEDRRRHAVTQHYAQQGQEFSQAPPATPSGSQSAGAHHGKGQKLSS